MGDPPREHDDDRKNERSVGDCPPTAQEVPRQQPQAEGEPHVLVGDHGEGEPERGEDEKPRHAGCPRSEPNVLDVRVAE